MTAERLPLPAPGSRAATILVVEDERVVARGLQVQLEAMGYSVPAFATCGGDAIELAGRLRPDLVLMDIHLDSEMDGVEAARIIRERFQTPVVYLTAYSNQQIVERAKVTEPFGYILKPYEERELHIIIQVALYRHQVERKLQQRERLLDATLRGIGDGVIATDADGRVTFLNPPAERLTGWRQDEATGQPLGAVFRVVHEGTEKPMDSPLPKALRDKAVVPLANHASLVRKDGAQTPVEDSAAPILDDKEELLGGVLVFRDVTEKRLAARAVEKLAAVVSSSDDAIVTRTLDGAITTWNAGAERVFGYTAEEALGRNISMLAPPGREGEIQSALDKVRRGESIPAFETVRLGKDGRRIDVIMTVTPLRGEEGEVVGAAAITRDVTELRRLEEQYRQSQKLEAIGRLAGGIAHEFNNLLTVINGYTGLVLSDHHLNDKNREHLEQVARAGQRAATLTGQLLAHSRKSILQPQVVDLNAVLADTEKMLRPIIGEDIELRVLPAAGLKRINVDPSQMEHVVVNLVVNARDAMPGGGTLTIETANVELAEGAAVDLPAGPYVVLSVRDTGLGMDQATQSRVFEPFFTTKPVGEGTGLGLAMVYGFAKQSGGDVRVSSQPGQGAVFHVYLPAVTAEPTGEVTPGGSQVLPSGSETVLLVEDEEGVRRVASLVLTRCGYKVIAAAGGEEALQLIARHAGPLDLLITDVVMPGMSGGQVAGAVRAMFPNIKLLFVSGYAEDAFLRLGNRGGRQNFLQKPYTTKSLARKVREVLGAA